MHGPEASRSAFALGRAEGGHVADRVSAALAALAEALRDPLTRCLRLREAAARVPRTLHASAQALPDPLIRCLRLREEAARVHLPQEAADDAGLRGIGHLRHRRAGRLAPARLDVSHPGTSLAPPNR